MQREREAAGGRTSTLTRDSTLERESAFERSISTTRPASLQAIDLSLNVVSHGKLTWRTVLAWLREDKIVSEDDVERTARRFAGGNSAQHPLVRIGSAGLQRVGDGKVLDTETLTEWLARRTKLPYVRIDPLKVDVGRVADVMSIQYAERRHALPLSFGLTEVTIATCEPLDTLWVSEIEGHTRRTVKLVIVNPIEIARYTTEFYALSRSVRNADQDGRVGGARQLRAAGRARQDPPSSSTPTTRASSRSSTGSGSTRSTSARPTSTSSRAASEASSASASTASCTPSTSCRRAS